MTFTIINYINVTFALLLFATESVDRECSCTVFILGGVDSGKSGDTRAMCFTNRLMLYMTLSLILNTSFDTF